MPIVSPRLVCPPLALGLLAGCGGGGSGWADDACATLTADEAGAAAGVSVASAALGSASSDANTTLSNCLYTTSGGATFLVALNEDLTGARTIDQVVAAANSGLEGVDPVEEVPVSTGKAFWNARLKSLSYYPTDSRMITVTPPGAVNAGGGSELDEVLIPKALALALAAAAP